MEFEPPIVGSAIGNMENHIEQGGKYP